MQVHMTHNAQALDAAIPAQDVLCGVVFSKKGNFQIFSTEHAKTTTANDNGDELQRRRIRAIATLLAVPEVLDMVANIAEELHIPHVI